MMNKIVVIVLIVVALGVGFFGGMFYQKSTTQSGNQAYGQAGGGGQFRRAGFNGNARNRPVFGKITSSDDKSITVEMTDGSSKIVLVTTTTSINKAAPATVSDLKSGETVAVFGSANSDGSVTAQSIQLNPQMRVSSQK